MRVGKISLFKNSTVNLERYLKLLGFRVRCQTLKRIHRAEYFFYQGIYISCENKALCVELEKDY